MCGLFGSISISLSEEDLRLTENLGILAKFRGEDSTGIITVDENSTVSTIKRPWPSPYFLYSKAYHDHLALVKGPRCIIGHTRHTTVGSLDENNIHPHEFGDIVGVHNGTVPAFTPHSKDDDRSDSSYLYEMLSKTSLQEVIDKMYSDLNPAYVLIWVNKKEQTINIIKNSKRPLYSYKIKDVEFWSSDSEHLRFVEDRVYRVASLPKEFDNHTLYTRSFYDESWTKEKIEPTKVYKPSQTQSYRPTSSSNWNDYMYNYNDEVPFTISRSKLTKKEKKLRKKALKATGEAGSNIIVLDTDFKNTPKKKDPRYYIGYFDSIKFNYSEAENKINRIGCYMCKGNFRPEHKLWWRSCTEFLCDKCFRSPVTRRIEGYNNKVFESKFRLGKLLVA